jgi:hypothetical protein
MTATDGDVMQTRLAVYVAAWPVLACGLALRADG